MHTTELWVERGNLRNTKVVERQLAPLAEGEVLVKIDKFGLTANNVSYAVSGDMIGYWKYYPAEGDWGKVPVWGFADVVESRCDEIPVGERIWGFLPMAAHAVLQPGKVNARQFTDMAAHRQPLPGLYNDFMRTKDDPAPVKQAEDARCVLFPLFATSYVLYDYFVANEFFGAKQVVVASASSKTGFGLAWLVHHDKAAGQRVVGLTSPGNVGFVQALKVCDQVESYDRVSAIDASLPTIFVDMSGSGPVVSAVHQHVGANVVESCIVGATHWEEDRTRGELPGAKPTFFFAPAHIGRRNKEWGPGVLIGKAMMAGAQITASIAGTFSITRTDGPAAVEKAFVELVNNKVPPSRGLLLSMQGGAGAR